MFFLLIYSFDEYLRLFMFYYEIFDVIVVGGGYVGMEVVFVVVCIG